MSDILKLISQTSVPTILVIAGIAFIFMSFADKVSGQFTISEQRKTHAMIAGLFLLLVGIGFHVFESRIQSDATGGPEAVAATMIGTGEPPPKVFRTSFNCTNYIRRPKEKRSVQEDVLCLYQNPAAADLNLGDVYKALLKVIPSSQEPALRQEQRAWPQQRDLDCRGEWSELEGDTPPLRLMKCLEDVTNTRAADLDARLRSLSGTVTTAKE